jgi:hypothetical protein
VLDVRPRLVLMAGPGGGNSTFVNVMAMSMASELLGLPRANLAILLVPLPDDATCTRTCCSMAPWCCWMAWTKCPRSTSAARRSSRWCRPMPPPLTRQQPS